MKEWITVLVIDTIFSLLLILLCSSTLVVHIKLNVELLLFNNEKKKVKQKESCIRIVLDKQENDMNFTEIV